VTGASSEFLPQVKVLALALHPGAEAIAPSRESLISRSYPLTRAVYAYFNRPPDSPLDARLKAFLRYILSDEAQRDVVQSNDYLPLSSQIRAEQLQKLE
jgi:phosphate transport system substrate-binding protein